EPTRSQASLNSFMRSAAANSLAVQKVSNRSRNSGSSRTSMLAGKLKLAATHQLAHDVDQLGMVLHGPVNGGIHITSIEHDEAVGERLAGLDLSIDHGIVAGLHGGEPP